MTRRSTRTATVSAATLLLLGVLGAAPALAAEPDLTVEPLPVGDRVCTVVAQPTPPGQRIEFTPAPVTECFDSIGQALESRSGEPVTDPDVLAGDPAALQAYAQEHNASVSSRTAGATAASVATGYRMIGISHKGKNHTGEGKIYYGVGTGGCAGVTFGFPRLANYLQNNVISAMRSYGNCWTTLYDLENYAKGTVINCKPDCATLGSMDNRASSLVFRPQGTIG